MKILADPLFPEGVVENLRKAGYDAEHAGKIGAGDLPVREILRLAAFENRVLLTRNRGLARLVEAERGQWPSVIFFRQLEAGPDVMTQILLNLLGLFDEDLAHGAMVIVRDGQTLLRRFIRDGHA